MAAAPPEEKQEASSKWARAETALDITLGVAKPILEFLEPALDLAPVPGLGLIPKALSAILDRVELARANKDSRESFRTEVKGLSLAIRDTLVHAKTSMAKNGAEDDKAEEAAVGIAHSKELESGIKGLLTTLQTLQQRVQDLHEGTGACGFFVNVLYASQDEGVLGGMKTELSAAVRIFQVQGQAAIRRGIEDIKRTLAEADDQRAIESLAWVDAGFRSVDELKSGFLVGTRKELFEELESWWGGTLPRDGPKRFYLLGGGAGVGKSAIAHQLCERLSHVKAPSGAPLLGASFFFVRDGGDLGSARLLFTTLARQLALSQPALRPHIVKAARQYSASGVRQQIEYAFKELLQEPLSHVSHVDPVFLVIDGLDECMEEDLLSKALGYLLALVRALPWLYVLVASRPQPHVMAALTTAADLVHQRDLSETLEEWEHDVAFYLEQTVPKIPGYKKFLENHPEYLARLVERAGGLFIFARTAVNVLDKYKSNPSEGFRIVLSSERASSLSPLDDLYLKILQISYSEQYLTDSADEYSSLLIFLHIIALQAEPLLPGVIALLGNGLWEHDVIKSRIQGTRPARGHLSDESVVILVSHLRSVLSINSNGCVVLLHATFREFLCAPLRCTDPLYQVGAGEGHAALAAVCLSAFSLQTIKDVLRAQRRHERVLVSYARYAARYWSRQHLRHAAHTTQLVAALESLVSSTQIPLISRLTIRRLVEREQYNGNASSASADISRFFRDAGHDQPTDEQITLESPPWRTRHPVSDEYARLACYCDIYLERQLTHAVPGLAIDQGDLRSEIYRGTDGFGPCESGLFDMQKYDRLCSSLYDDINRDAEGKGLWYDLSLRPLDTFIVKIEY